MTGRVPNRRRIYLIDAKIQGNFVLFLIFFLIGYNVITRMLQKLGTQMDLPVFLPIYLVVMAGYIGLAGIFYSHRFAGPLYQINKVLGDISRGDLFTSIHCRNENMLTFKEIAGKINQTTNEFRESICIMEGGVEALSRETEALRDRILCRRDEFPEIVEHLEKIRRHEQELQSVIRKYSVR